MHSIGISSSIDGNAEIIEIIGEIPYSAFDKDFRIYTGSTSVDYDSNKEISNQKGWRADDNGSDFNI